LRNTADSPRPHDDARLVRAFVFVLAINNNMNVAQIIRRMHGSGYQISKTAIAPAALSLALALTIVNANPTLCNSGSARANTV
jgi:hypothetical protein